MLSDKILSVTLQNLLELEDKLEAATRFKQICETFDKNEKNFSDDYEAEKFLWTLLDPLEFAKNYRKKDYVDRKLSQLKWFIAGGISLDEYEQKVRQYNNAVFCGLVWTQNYLAYRCRTCANTPSMSLCADCFLGGNHNGHDFNMFKSQAGGACDCGDGRVMLESGFCSRHGPNALKNKQTAPKEFFLTLDVVLPHVFRCILCLFAASFSGALEDEQLNDDPNEAFNPVEELFAFLQSLSEYGAAMKERLSYILLNKKLYEELVENGVSHFKHESELLLQMRNNYRNYALPSLQPICNIEDGEILDCPLACPKLLHTTFLEELMFWLVKLHLPQRLVTFLLSLLPCESYKKVFVDAFALHYTRIAMLLLNEQSSSTLNHYNGDSMSNRVIHISVQLGSNDEIAIYMAKELKFTRVLVASLYNTIKRCLIICTLNNSMDLYHMVANCRSRIMENQVYWVVSHDFRNCLSHKEVAVDFLRDPSALDLYCCLISSFQGMNTNVRKLVEHEEFESRAYFAAFMAEIEICSTVCKELISHMTDNDSYDCILSMIQNITCQIQEFFEAIHFNPPSCWKPPLLECCFHLPLHRTWASFVCQAFKLNMQINLPCETFLRQLIMHPLAIQVARSEIQCDMWVRNGVSAKYQSYYYVHSSFSLVDIDIYLLQVCATRVNPDWLILTIFERFHLADWLSFSPVVPVKSFLRHEWNMPMLEACLRLLATLLTNRINLGMDEETCLKFEIATLLCQGGRTHSQIIEVFSSHRAANRSNVIDRVEGILTELADYRAPRSEADGNMSEGIYTLKDKSWETYFDPLMLALRCVQPRNFQAAMDHYRRYLWSNKIIENENKAVWPPYKLPANGLLHGTLPIYDGLRRLLRARSLHSLIFVILFKALNDENNVSDSALSLTIFLLELIIADSLQEAKECTTDLQMINSPPRPTVIDLVFCGWFTSNNIFENMCRTIDRVLCFENASGLSRSCQADTDQGDFPDLTRLRSRKESLAQDTNPQSQQMALVTSSQPAASPDLPFIDSSMEVDRINSTYGEFELDYCYKKAIAAIPPSLRQRYCLPSTSDVEDGLRDAVGWTIVEEMCDAGSSDAEFAETMAPTLALDHQQRLALEGPTASIDNGSTESEVVTALLPVLPALLGNLHEAMSTEDDSMTEEAEDGFSSNALPEAPSLQRPKALPQPHIFVSSIRQSLIGLLIALHDKMAASASDSLTTASRLSCAAKTRHYFPPKSALTEGEFRPTLSNESSPIPVDGVDRIARLLDAICAEGGEICLKHVTSICEALARKRRLTSVMRSTDSRSVEVAGSDDRLGGRTTPDLTISAGRRKEAAKVRQMRLMAQFKSAQKSIYNKLVSKECERLTSNLVEEKQIGDSLHTQSEQELLKLAESEYEIDSHNAVQCVICCCQASASEEYPLGLIVSVKSTGVIAHQCLHDPSALEPCQDRDFDECLIEFSGHFKRSQFDKTYSDVRMENFQEALFSTDINCLSNSTIYVQTCGHYVHNDCHETYMNSLRADSQRTRYSVLQVDRGEFHCPLCRRFSNAVLPVLSGSQPSYKRRSADAIDRFPSCSKSIEEICHMIAHTDDDSNNIAIRLFRQSPQSRNSLDSMSDAFFNALATRLSPEQKFPPSALLFLHNVVYSNVEILSLLKDQNIELARSCTAELCALIARQLPPLFADWISEFPSPLPSDLRLIWARLTGLKKQHPIAVGQAVKKLFTGQAPDIPLLFVDPGAMLVRFGLKLIRVGAPLHYFHLVVAAILNLVTMQICAREVFSLSSATLRDFSVGRRLSSQDVVKKRDLSTLFQYMCQMFYSSKFDKIPLIDSDDVNMFDEECDSRETDEVKSDGAEEVDLSYSSVVEQSNSTAPSRSKSKASSEPATPASHIMFLDLDASSSAWRSMKCKIQNAHIPFLRFAAIFKICAYGGNTVESDLKAENQRNRVVSADRSILSQINRKQFNDLDWLKEFTTGVTNRSDWLTLHAKWGRYAVKDLLKEAGFHHADRSAKEMIYDWLPWSKPLLLPLPKFYDVLFRKLYQRPCQQCQSVPKESLLCLLCGRLLCAGNDCCLSNDTMSIMEAEKHAEKCGGLGLYLSVNSSLIVIVEKRRCAVWGSLYLDAHGEEDRGLKRGKTLILSQERFALLERQYLSHSFDDACKRWQWTNQHTMQI